MLADLAPLTLIERLVVGRDEIPGSTFFVPEAVVECAAASTQTSRWSHSAARSTLEQLVTRGLDIHLGEAFVDFLPDRPLSARVSTTPPFDPVHAVEWSKAIREVTAEFAALAPRRRQQALAAMRAILDMAAMKS